MVGLRLTGKSQMCVANLAPLFGGAFSVGRCATNRQPAPLMRRACWSPSRNGNLCDGKHQVAGKPTLPLRRMARADLAEPAGESKIAGCGKIQSDAPITDMAANFLESWMWAKHPSLAAALENSIFEALEDMTIA